MQIWAESGKSALPICNYSQILYQFLTFTQNLKRSQCWLLFPVIAWYDIIPGARSSKRGKLLFPVIAWYDIIGNEEPV